MKRFFPMVTAIGAVTGAYTLCKEGKQPEKNNERFTSQKTTLVKDKNEAIFADFTFEEPADSYEGLVCSYRVFATPNEDSEYYDIGRNYTDVPVTSAIEHIRAEFKAFNKGYNVPDYYATSLGFPWIRASLQGCKLQGESVECPFTNSSWDCVIKTLTMLEKEYSDNCNQFSCT